MRAIPSVHQHPDRLNVPLMRRGDELVGSTWDECLDDAGAKIRRILDERYRMVRTSQRRVFYVPR